MKSPMSARPSRTKLYRTTCHDAAFLILSFLLSLLIGPFGLAGSALAEPARLTGDALRQAVSGRTVLIATAIGAVSIRYHSEGTMTGRTPALVAGLGTERDRGRWWIADDGLCQRWHRWLDAKRFCFKLHQAGAIVHWLRDDGLTGTATIRGPVAAGVR
jgi:hypothetical protein